MVYVNFERDLEKLIDSVTDYKMYVDGLAEAYKAEKTILNRGTEELRGIFSDSLLEESDAKWESDIPYGELMKIKRDEIIQKINDYIEQVKKEMDSYFYVSPSEEFVDEINGIIASESATMTDKGFETLKNSVSNYMEQKLFLHLLENKVVKIEAPYTKIELPDINRAYAELESFKNSVMLFMLYYSGAESELNDYLGVESPQWASFADIMESFDTLIAENHKIDFAERDIYNLSFAG